MATIPMSGSGDGKPKKDTQVTFTEDMEGKDVDLKHKVKILEPDPGSGGKNPETIPLARLPSYDEDFDKIKRILITGCSCTESMKKMWTQLQLLQDPVLPKSSIEDDQVDGVGVARSLSINGYLSHSDRVDHVASTTELISSTLKSRQSIPNKDVQKEASILRKHWCRLVQTIPGEKVLLISLAIQKKPLIVDPFLEMLSESIYFAPSSGKLSGGTDDETTIHIDLRDLLECPGDDPNEFREAQVLVHIVDEIEDMEVKDRILAHPIVTTFATLKYKKYRLVSFILVFYHLLFALLFTNYAFHVFLAEHPAAEVAIFTKYSSVVLSLMAFLSSIKTATTFFASGIQFDLTTTRRAGEIFCAFVAIFMCLLPSFGYPFPFTQESVNKDITAFGVMSSWLVLLSYFTKFNQTAVYVQTFFQIVKNYIQFLWMVALCQLIALSASYSLIFHKSEHGFMITANLSRSFLRVLTGRMNYDDFTNEKADVQNPFSVFNYFFLFFVLSTVMMGMIIGLATNGLQDTRTASAVNVLCQVIKDIAELEWIIYKLKVILPHSLYIRLVQKISLKNMLTRGLILEIRPHDKKQDIIPDSLKKSIYSHLIDRGATCHNRFSSQNF